MEITILDQELNEYDINFLERALPEEVNQRYFNSLMNTIGRKQGVLESIKRIEKGYEISYIPYSSITLSVDETINEIIQSNPKLKDFTLIGYLKMLHGLIINKIQAVIISKDEYQVIYI